MLIIGAVVLAGLSGWAPKPVPLPVQPYVPTVMAPQRDPVPQSLLDLAQAAPVTWTRTWSYEILARYYPTLARSLGLEGDVIVICDWDDVGRITDCSVFQETPADRGFGAASVTMLKVHGRVGPKDPAVPLRAGKGLPTLVRWKLG